MTTHMTHSRTSRFVAVTIGHFITLLLCLAAPASAQQGVLVPGAQEWSNAANTGPCNGCLLNAYIAGTTTRLDTYTDAALTTPNANPVVLDSAGRATVFVSDRAYKFVLTTSAGVEIWTRDNVVGRASPAAVLSKTGAYTVAATDGKDVLVKADASGGAFTVTLYTAVGNSGRIIRVVKTDASGNVVTIDGNGAQTINGATTAVLPGQYDAMTLMSDGANWVATESSANNAQRAGTCQCRLTLTSGTAVTTSDVTAAGTLYLTPFDGNQLATYNGTNWDGASFTEVSLALTVTSGTNYDVFVYRNAGVPTLELTAWTNDTTRATALTLQDGVLVRSGATTRLYVGTIRASASNQTEDSLAKRFVWNYYNRAPRPMRVLEATNSWTYTLATYRCANFSVTCTNQLAVVVGIAGLSALRAQVGVDFAQVATVRVAIGEDSTSVPMPGSIGRALSQGGGERGAAWTSVDVTPALGYHFYAWLEWSTASGTTTWYGDDGGTVTQSGMTGMWSS